MCRAIRQSNRGARGGVSILELTVTVLILGIIAAIASPTYSSSLQNYRTEVASQRIIQDIEQARRVARQTNSSQTITFSTISHSYTIDSVGSLDRVGQTYDVSLGLAPYHSQLLFLATSEEPSVSNLHSRLFLIVLGCRIRACACELVRGLLRNGSMSLQYPAE